MPESEVKNSEIIFIYQAKLSNPNGDPDEENRPRLDPVTSINLVSDVRLKRFLRDYLVNKYGEDKVWVTKLEGKHVTAEERAKKFQSKDDLLRSCMDARLFGAVITIKDNPYSITGPCQFSWGYSLHPVEIVESSKITSIFTGRKSENEEKSNSFGNFGSDWRVYYSMIAFYGAISGSSAKAAGTSEKDILMLDDYLWKSVISNTNTRSKIGHYPLMYLRVEYNDDYFMGDLRRFLDVSHKTHVRDLSDVNLDIQRLVEALRKNIKRVNKVYVRLSDEMSGFKSQLADSLMDKFSEVQEYNEK